MHDDAHGTLLLAGGVEVLHGEVFSMGLRLVCSYILVDM